MRACLLALAACSAAAPAPLAHRTAPGAPDPNALPFVGARAFNFYGGTGTGYVVHVSADWRMAIYYIARCGHGVLYEGEYRSPVWVEGDRIFIEATQARLISLSGSSCTEDFPCVSELSSAAWPVREERASWCGD